MSRNSGQSAVSGVQEAALQRCARTDVPPGVASHPEPRSKRPDRSQGDFTTAWLRGCGVGIHASSLRGTMLRLPDRLSPSFSPQRPPDETPFPVESKQSRDDCGFMKRQMASRTSVRMA